MTSVNANNVGRQRLTERGEDRDRYPVQVQPDQTCAIAPTQGKFVPDVMCRENRLRRFHDEQTVGNYSGSYIIRHARLMVNVCRA